MKKQISLTLLFVCLMSGLLQAQQQTIIKGRVVSISHKPIMGVNIALVGTAWGDATNKNGHYSIKNIEAGTYTIIASFVGYKTQKKEITIKPGKTYTWNISLQKSDYNLEALTVIGKGQQQQIEEQALNVDVVDADKLANTTLSAGKTLDRISGVNVRVSGGLGSRMTVSMNGFRGKQVKIFINGIPMSNFGSAFQLNNIPVDYIDHIEVYKGVVPISLGADALGGAINIITDRYQQTRMDLSFSYGSFNTRKTSVNAVYVDESGFTARVYAYRNYSDNNYEVDVSVANLETGQYYTERSVERFHDTYRNSTVIANVGVVNTSFADQFLIGITLGKTYDEIQTGSRLTTVYGGWHTRSTIIMPTLKYKKQDFIIHNLNFSLSANYNLGSTQSIDTLNRVYNWLGQYRQFSGPGGERTYSKYKFQNHNGIVVSTFDYQVGEHHSISLSNTFTTFNREGYDKLQPNAKTYSQPKKSIKNVTGLGYKYVTDRWNAYLFAKHYYQNNSYAQPYNPTGDYGDVAYYNRNKSYSFFGYGLALSYFILDHLQLKFSYEKSFRLPSPSELFGNVVSLEGNIDLKPESSNNYNLGASYWLDLGEGHHLSISENVFYRNADDFIRARLNENQIMLVMDNLGSVTNLGFTSEIRYSYLDKLSIKGSLTYQNLRNDVKYVNGHKSVVYRDRIPNIPYLYGNINASYNFNSLWSSDHSLRISYNLQYVHSFYLYWPSLGNESDKLTIPRQISHNIRLTYNLGSTGFQFTLEARNITDNNIYDNFSLQKPGRSFTGKITYTF